MRAGIWYYSRDFIHIFCSDKLLRKFHFTYILPWLLRLCVETRGHNLTLSLSVTAMFTGVYFENSIFRFVYSLLQTEELLKSDTNV